MAQFYFGVAALLVRLEAEVDCWTTMIQLLYGNGPHPDPWSDQDLLRWSL